MEFPHKNGQIILAQIENDFTVKRYHKDSKKIQLNPDNPLFKSIEITKNHDFLICGVVVSILRVSP